MRAFVGLVTYLVFYLYQYHMCLKRQCRKPLEIEESATKVRKAYSVHKILIVNANNMNLFVSLLRYSNVYITFKFQNGRRCNNGGVGCSKLG